MDTPSAAQPATTLTDMFRQLTPTLHRIYVTPHIERFSRFNPYLQLLYKPLIGTPGAPEIISTGFFSPMWIIRALAGEKSIYHHHWFECHDLRSFLNCIWKIKMAILFRLAGGKIVWTIHNQRPHRGKWQMANTLLRQAWSKIPHALHLHCSSAISIMQQELDINPQKCFVVPHPPFPVHDVSEHQALTTCKKLFPDFPDSGPRFLLFGYLSAYKGIPEAIDAFIASNCEGHLLIAGRFKDRDETFINAVCRRCQEFPNIHLAPQFVDEWQMAALFKFTDFALFNYRDILTSGGAEMARSYGLPIIAPRSGCLAELTRDVYLFDSQKELQKLLANVRRQ